MNEIVSGPPTASHCARRLNNPWTLKTSNSPSMSSDRPSLVRSCGVFSYPGSGSGLTDLAIATVNRSVSTANRPCPQAPPPHVLSMPLRGVHQGHVPRRGISRHTTPPPVTRPQTYRVTTVRVIHWYSSGRPVQTRGYRRSQQR